MFPGPKFSIEASKTWVIQSDDWDELAWMIAMIPKIGGFFWCPKIDIQAVENQRSVSKKPSYEMLQGFPQEVKI